MLGQAQEHLALAVGDPGGDVQQPVAQRLGLGAVQLRFVGQEHRLGQGEQVGGDQGELDPDLLDVVVPRGQVSQAGVLAGADAVFDAGVRPVAGSRNASCPRGVLVVKAW